jgi:RNA polymerase sigma factor (sigma-70 family)
MRPPCEMTEEYFAHSYQRGFQATSRFLASRGIQADLVFDIAQAAWVKAWERREQLRDASLLLTWVNTIALNIYRTSLRREKPTAALTDAEGLTTDSDWSVIDAERILGECKASDRVVLESHYIQGYKINEIAEQNNWTETAVRIRLLRARRKMKLLFGGGRRVSSVMTRKIDAPDLESPASIACEAA